MLRFPRWLGERGYDAEQRIAFGATHTRGGGRRGCFVCPLGTARKCVARGGRARKLSLRAGGTEWGCRWCHGLQYRRTQRGPKRADAEDREFAEFVGVDVAVVRARQRDRGWGV